MGTELLARADRLRTQRTPFVLATVVRAERPTSAKAGDRAIVMSDGTIEGFVGGVCAESTVRVEGLRLLGQAGTGESTLLRITPTDDDTISTAQEVPEGLVVVGNPCLSGGTLDIFLEAVLPAALMHVFGDAPIARALVTVAQAAGYAVTASDDPATPIAPDTAAVVVASHGRDEETVLAAALRAGVAYVGLVASPRRGAVVVSEVDAAEELRARVHTPAGLNIGARTPLEIAVSVLAEVIASTTGDVAPATARPPRQLLPMLAPAADAAPTAVDPICGMTVAAVPASLHTEYGGRTWYFCAPGCQRAFAADPARYAQ
jgi:xanthine dehydrogenase accessory factor